MSSATDSEQSLRAIFNGNLDAFPARAAAHFAALHGQHIPNLTIHNPPDAFPDRALVAFRAMIQDTSPSPEIYLARFPHDQPGGWGLAMPDHPADYSDADLRQSTVLWAVSVPGEEHSVQGQPQSPVHPHKFPVPGVPHIGVQIKVYDSALADTLKTGDISTFVGFLTTELWLQDELAELVPTLHVLYSVNPPPPPFPASFSSDIRKIRTALIDWIAEEALGGDTDAAEWTLLASIATTQSRSPPIYPPSLTLSSFPSSPTTTSTSTLHHVLSLILPLFNTLPLTLDTINKTSFYPESQNEDLQSGWLQVPNSSVYLLTETGITQGTITDKGIQNLRALQGVMTSQSLDYVFPFSRFSFPTDINFIVLTESKKSPFFQTSVNVPLKLADGWDFYKPREQINMPDEQILNQWKTLVAGAKVGKVTINDETAQYIQDDFVRERRATATTTRDDKRAPTITSDDLVHRMMTARLLALSYHEPFVTTAIWEEAKSLESRRKARI